MRSTVPETMFRAHILKLALVAALTLKYCDANLKMFSKQGTGRFSSVSTSLVVYTDLACCRECQTTVGCRGVNFNPTNLTCQLVTNVEANAIATDVPGWEYYVFDNPNIASQSTTIPASSTSASVPTTTIPASSTSASVPTTTIPASSTSASVPTTTIPASSTSASVPTTTTPASSTSASVPTTTTPASSASASVPTTTTTPQLTTTTPVASTPQLENCINGWDSMLDSCYQFVLAGLSWNDARTNCNILRSGSIMVDINSQAEQSDVERYILQNGLSGMVWLGGQANGSHLVWLRTDEPIDNGWTNWDSSSPDLDPCVAMDMSSSGYKWATIDCSLSKQYVCEYPKMPASTGTTTAAIASTTAQECVPGWEPMLDSCYQFVMAGLSWHSAQVNCDILRSGATLLDVNSHSEQLYLEGYMLQNGLTGTVWTDGKDDGSQLVWHNIDEPIDNGWTNWNTAYPDGQPCVAMIRIGSDYMWITLDCAENNPYVCEYPKIEPVTVAPGLSTTTEDNGCLPGWRAMFARCYLGVQAVLSWDDARTECTNLKGDATLIDISSSNEQLFFTGYLVQCGLSGDVWLGGRNYGTGYVWDRTNERLPNTYTNWKDGQPQLADPCVVMDMGDPDYKWATLDCSFPKPYVCQYQKI